MKTENIDLKELELHDLSAMTPAMTEEQYIALKTSLDSEGQLEPIKVFRGKIVDGRHRFKCALELEWDTLEAIKLDNNLTLDDLKELVMGYETRRHQTPLQKGIFAYKEFEQLQEEGNKISQGEVAKKYGTNRKMLGRVKKLSSLVSIEVMDILFNGGKINIGDENKPMLTDSIVSLINYFEGANERIINSSIQSDASQDFTDEEMIKLYGILESNKKELNSDRLFKKLASIIYIDSKNL